jgi:enediyne biosynthesis protein E4
VIENVTGEDGAVRLQRPGREALGTVIDHGNRVDWDEGIMTANLFDFDNDGRLDIYWGGSDYPGNRGLLFHHTDDVLAFEEVGTADFFEHNRSHGVTTADFDGDGDVDVVVGHSHSRCGPPNDCYPTTNVRYFENVAGQAQNFVRLSLAGTAANRAAIGARVTIESGGLTQVQEVGGGFGHFGAQNDLALTFGLGANCGDVNVTVRWPDASLTTETFTLASGWTWKLVQGEAPTAVQ